jgi:hypothetical protein
LPRLWINETSLIYIFHRHDIPKNSSASHWVGGLVKCCVDTRCWVWGVGTSLASAEGGTAGTARGTAAAVAASKNNAATTAKGNAAATVTLDAKAIQTASNLDGNQTPADGQAASLT